MKFISVKRMEDLKAAITADYVADMAYLYDQELIKVFKWFVENYPKRRLEWLSRMGSSFFVLDGEILHWEVLEDVWSNNGWDHGYKDAAPDRIAKKLEPLWNIFQSIHDHTHVEGTWIQTEEYDSEDFK